MTTYSNFLNLALHPITIRTASRAFLGNALCSLSYPESLSLSAAAEALSATAELIKTLVENNGFFGRRTNQGNLILRGMAALAITYLFEHMDSPISSLQWGAVILSAEVINSLIQRRRLDALDKRSPLIKAIENNDLKRVKSLISKGERVDALCSWGREPFFSAVCTRSGSDIKIAEFLLECGAQINRCDKSGNTPLHGAIWNDNLEMVKFLLKQGANVNLQSNDGTAPLHCSTWDNNLEMVELVLKYGANVHLRNNRGETALKQAIVSERIEIANRLILAHLLQDREASQPEYVESVEWASNFWKRCQSELAELGQNIFKVPFVLSPLDLLKISNTSKLALISRNPEIMDGVMEPRFSEEYPILGPRIQSRSKKGETRRKYLDVASKRLTDGSMSEHRLPVEMFEKILDFLPTSQLQALSQPSTTRLDFLWKLFQNPFRLA